jgi:hypothetical protein
MSEPADPAMRGYDEIADELYGLPLKDFTAARTAAVTKAKQDGDPDLARRIGELRKPTSVGWLANQLSRKNAEQIQGLADLGQTLRDAMRRLAGDELRKSAGRQQQAVYALVREAEKLTAVSAETKRGLEQTLHAAIVDPQVAAELVRGRLTGTLTRSGFPEMQLDPAAAAPAPPSPQKAQRAARRDRELLRAEAERAAQAYAQAQQTQAEAEQAAREAQARVEQLRDELDAALTEQNRAESEVRSARREVREADQAAQRAARRLSDFP